MNALSFRPKTCNFRKSTRFFWRLIAHFVDHRSPRGRIIRTRRIKRPMPDDKLRLAIAHANNVFNDFDSQTQILFLGSSHTAYGIAPEEFETLRGWNAGYNSGDSRMAYYTYLALRTKWPKQADQCVVISDDFWMISHQTEFTPEFYQAVVASYFCNMPFRSNYLMEKHHRYVGEWVTALAKTEHYNCLKQCRGFIPGLPVNTPMSHKEVALRVRNHCKMASFEPTELTYVRKLKEAVEADGRTLVFLRFPVQHDYLQAFDAINKDVWSVSDEPRKNTPLLDYFRLPVDEADWHDADHFSEQGARHFTKRIEPDLLAIVETLTGDSDRK